MIAQKFALQINLNLDFEVFFPIKIYLKHLSNFFFSPRHGLSRKVPLNAAHCSQDIYNWSTLHLFWPTNVLSS